MWNANGGRVTGRSNEVTSKWEMGESVYQPLETLERDSAFESTRYCWAKARHKGSDQSRKPSSRPSPSHILQEAKGLVSRKCEPDTKKD